MRKNVNSDTIFPSPCNSLATAIWAIDFQTPSPINSIRWMTYILILVNLLNLAVGLAVPLFCILLICLTQVTTVYA